jgi:uncharacterized membrane protein YedE/YeeE
VIHLNSPEALRAIAGGMLIGAGAATLLLLNGRVAGVSGVLGNVWRVQLVRNMRGDL